MPREIIHVPPRLARRVFKLDSTPERPGAADLKIFGSPVSVHESPLLASRQPVGGCLYIAVLEVVEHDVLDGGVAVAGEADAALVDCCVHGVG